MQRLTLEEIEAIPGEVLTAKQVSYVLGLDQDTIRGQARERPELLGFPVICAGRKVKIPKRPFLEFMGKKDRPPAGTGKAVENYGQ